MPKEEAAWKNVRKEERRCWRVQKQFRALPCKFFGADKKFCANGDKCAFSHIYKGCDYHASARASDEATWDRKARALVSAGETSPTADSRSAERTRAAGLTREPVKRKRTVLSLGAFTTVIWTSTFEGRVSLRIFCGTWARFPKRSG